MKFWEIVEVSPERVDPKKHLTDAELIGLSVLAAQSPGSHLGTYNVYHRAWMKIQPAVDIAIGEGGD